VSDVPSGAARVVIVGGGFAGLACARRLARAPVRVTLVDRRNHHLFQPLLYQVATAALNPGDIAAPIRGILRAQANADVVLGEVRSIDRTQRKVVLADGELAWDFLVVATGANHSYFGHDEWAPFAPGLKTVEDALAIRRRVLLAYERAEREDDPERRRAWLTFVVVGGGATGVELAGALAEIGRHSLVRDFRRIDSSQAHVVLIEAAPRLLPPFVEMLAAKAKTQLERLGAEVRVATRVTSIDGDGVTLQAGGQETRLAAKTVLWAAGVAASPLAKTLGVPLDRAGRVPVEPTLLVTGTRDLFVAGDLAALAVDGRPVPGVAPAAIQMGRAVAANIERALRGEPLLPFRYRDKGTLATIGRAAAVADFGKFKVSGALAWLLWLAVHIYFLIGFRNRALVLFQWAWSWVTGGRGARLITEPGPDGRATPSANE
jgi:NADH dehydrogenase